MRTFGGFSGGLKLLLCLTVAVLCPADDVFGATINVPADHATIQAALDAASSGDTVLVGPGSYVEHDLSFGGKDIILKSVDGPESTTIDGNGLGPVFRLNGTLSRAAVIDGFTITNGYGTSFKGGGVSISFGKPTIRNNIVIDNETTDGGGGIKANDGADPLIEGNHIEGNLAHTKGGGIQVVSARAEIRSNTITGNTALGTETSTGGGINVTASTGTPLLVDNIVTLNASSFSGGGISILGSSAELLRNQISENESKFGGGIHLETNAEVTSWSVTGNSFTNNLATKHGGGINIYAADIAANVLVQGNLISFNEAVEPGCVAGSDCGQGGGIRASQGTGEELYRSNTIHDNLADDYGGVLLHGLPERNKVVTFQGNRVEANLSLHEYPGVGCNGVATCVVANNLFISNGPSVSAPTPNTGGLFVRNVPTSTVENNYFRGNEGRLAGALLLSTSGTPMFASVRNNTFVGNVTTSTVDGSLRTNVDASIVNNVFQGDIRGISAKLSPAVTVHNNDFYGYSLGVYRTETVLHATATSLNGESFASGNIEVPPGFIDPNDVHLASSSQLLSAGPCAQAPATDIDGDSRPIGSGCEIGADEYNPDWLLIFEDDFESGNMNSWSHTLPVE